MSLTWKIVLPLALVLVALGIYSYRYGSGSPKPASPSSQTLTVDAEIDAVVEDASAEPTGTAEEDDDSKLMSSDAEALNNFNDVYASSDIK